MNAVLAFEFVDRRVLGGIRFVDPFGRLVLTPVTVTPVDAGVSLFVKRPGEIVVMAAPGLARHTAAFDAPPKTPALGSVDVVLDIRPVDPALGARRFTLKLPRNADASKPDPASAAVLIPLLPGSGGDLVGMAAAVRVNIVQGDGLAIEGAVVRLRPEGRPEVLAMTDAAGDALLLAMGVPLASPGPGATVRPDIAGEIDAIVDPALVRFHAAADILLARGDAARRIAGLIDPDDVVARLAASATAPVAVRVAPGRTTTAKITWTAP